MNDDTGALKAAYYGSMPSGVVMSGDRSGGSNWLSGLGSLLGTINPVLGLAGNIIGGLFGSSNQSKANEANIQMQRETNALQYRMFNEANAFTKEMWKAQNEYNTPENQAARLKAAGINPAFVFGNGSVSEAGGISSQSPPSLIAPHVDPYNIQPSVATGVDAFLQSQMQSAQIRNMHENERHLSIQNELDTMQMLDRVDSLRIDNKHKDLLRQFLFDTFNAQKAGVEKNNSYLDALTENLMQNTIAQKVHAEMEFALGQSQLNLNDRQMWSISQYVAQNWRALANDAQRIENERKQVGYYGESIQGQNAYLGNAAIHLMQQDAGYFEQIGISREMMDSEKFRNYVGTVMSGIGSFIGAGAGAFFGGKGIFQAGRTAVTGFR